MVRGMLLAAGLLLAAGMTAMAQTPAPTTPSAPAAPPPSAAAPEAMHAPTPPAAPPLHVRGTIVGLSGNVLTVNSRDGQKLAITLKEPITVASLTRLKLSAITPNSFVGAATRVDKNNKQIALEVLVFPEAMRGVGEGFYPWDLQPGSMMTNGTVTGEAKAAKGRQLTIGYKDKSSGTNATNTVDVPPSTPIVTFAPATAADLKPGAKIFCIAVKAPDGSLSAARVTVGKNGVVPPM